jgi:uncharacterized 2Fe-2S/4Fe-4S cluster protein (DUF4445 family)
MRAAPGAIEHVQIRNGEVFVSTIDRLPPIGICGSGILDAVAELRRSGILDEKGAILPGNDRVQRTAGGMEFVLVPQEKTGHGRAITISRKDINEVQLAKAAIRTGLDVLLEHAGLQADDIDEVLIAGAFGTYIAVPAALAVGMFPPVPLERFKQIGNAAGMGARQVLLSGEALAESTSIAARAQYVELTNQPGFQTRFLKAMYI